MFCLIILLILWTWGLTPLWVNIVCSVLLGIRMALLTARYIIKFVRDDENEYYYIKGIKNRKSK